MWEWNPADSCWARTTSGCSGLLAPATAAVDALCPSWAADILNPSGYNGAPDDPLREYSADSGGAPDSVAGGSCRGRFWQPAALSSECWQ